MGEKQPHPYHIPLSKFPQVGSTTPRDITGMLTTLNTNVRFFSDRLLKKSSKESYLYRQYLYERLNNERGLLFGEALLHRENGAFPEYFAVTIKPSTPDQPQEEDNAIVVFRFTDDSRPKGFFRTSTRLGEIRVPGKIETNDDALSYIAGRSTKQKQEESIPEVSLTSAQLMEIGRKIEFIDAFKAQTTPSSDAARKEKAKQFQTLRMNMLLQQVLPARRMSRSDATEILVDHFKDVHGNQQKDKIRIVIRGLRTAYTTFLYPDSMRKGELETLQKIIGEFNNVYPKGH